MTKYHIPVLQKKTIDFLQLRDNGIYVDATLGGGGHTKAILEANRKVKVIALDQDEDAIEETIELKKRNTGRLTILHDNFKNLRTRLALERIKKIDGILFDLGVSSHQFDTAERGFSYNKDSFLDMRMDQDKALTAHKIVNTFNFDQLTSIFFDYGEERESKRIANAIVKARTKKEIKTTKDLADIIENAVYSKYKIKAKSRIFQAIRICVNSELEILKSALKDAIQVLKPKGRIVVISYHSLEDKIVKHLFKYEEKECTCPPGLLKCVCGKVSTIRILTKKPITPGGSEIRKNKRARSAKLRAAQKREDL